jgi:hypothetical protein
LMPNRAAAPFARVRIQRVSVSTASIVFAFVVGHLTIVCPILANPPIFTLTSGPPEGKSGTASIRLTRRLQIEDRHEPPPAGASDFLLLLSGREKRKRVGIGASPSQRTPWLPEIYPRPCQCIALKNASSCTTKHKWSHIALGNSSNPIGSSACHERWTV